MKKKVVYDRLLENKYLPPYWQRKYKLTYQRMRKYYGLKGQHNNPMHEILVEKIAYLSVKIMYCESPDFVEKTGVPIENPLYMDKYDGLIKSMVKLVEQMQKYTEPKPLSKSINLNVTPKDIRSLSDADIDREIRRIVSGGSRVIEGSVSGETEKAV